jgi:PAS domain-containing protein
MATSAAGIALLDAVGEIADGSLPLAETLDRITALITPEWADFCMIDAIHEGTATRVAVRAEGDPDAAAVADWLRRRPPNTPSLMLDPAPRTRFAPWFVPKMTHEVLRGLAHDERDFQYLLSLRPRSAIIVPLQARGRTIGTITMALAWSPRRYRHPDLRLAQTLAGRVALALDNAGLFSDLESFERRMDNAMEILDEAVVMHDARGRLIYANPAAEGTLGFSLSEDPSETAAAKIEARFAIRAEDATPLPPEALIGRVPDVGGAPPGPRTLRVTSRTTGEERWYVVRSMPVEGSAGQPLYAVTAINDVTAVKRAEFGQRLLAGTGELLASSTDHRAILDSLARFAVPQFADWAAVAIPGEGGLVEQVAVAHADAGRAELARRLADRYPTRIDGEGAVPEVIRTGEAQLVEVSDELLRRSARDEEHLRLLRELDSAWAIVAPMDAGTKIVGALTFVNERGSRRFGEPDLQLAVEIGRRAGIAVENARLAGEQAEVARVLQHELLPPALPEIPGWDIAAMYRPAGEVNEAGGDFYDAFSTGEGWMIVLGDVTGRGAQAASLTALARYTARTAGMLSGDPRTALRMVHRALMQRREPKLLTMVIMLLPEAERESAAVEIYSAGHPLPLLLRDGDTVEVGGGGPLLGAHPDPEWHPDSVELKAGDQLIVYTDGVTDARNENGEFFGLDGLRARLSGCRDSALAVTRVEAALTSFVPGEPEDDAAMIAVMRSEAGSRRPTVDAVAAAP